jgi:hypothetical protein
VDEEPVGHEEHKPHGREQQQPGEGQVHDLPGRDLRDHVTPDDVRAVVVDCLRHRIVLSYEANAARKTTDAVVGEVVKVVAVA